MKIKKKTLKQVQAIVVWKGKILLLKKYDLRLKKGFWRLLKGKLEKGETPIKGLKRELFEEVGLRKNKIKIKKKVFSYDYESPKGVFRKVETFLVEAKEKPKLTREGRKEGIKEIGFFPASQALKKLYWVQEKKALLNNSL